LAADIASSFSFSTMFSFFLSKNKESTNQAKPTTQHTVFIPKTQKPRKKLISCLAINQTFFVMRGDNIS